MAAPRSKDQKVGGLYIITGCSPLLFDDCGGEDEGGDREEYASESDGRVKPDAERSCGGDGGWSSLLLYAMIVLSQLEKEDAAGFACGRRRALSRSINAYRCWLLTAFGDAKKARRAI